MDNLRKLIRTTLMGGILFLIPLVIVVAVLGKAFQIMKAVAKPVGNLIPVESIAGFAKVEVLTGVIMLLSCLIAGLVARSPWGKRVNEKLDGILLQMIPGYAWIKGVTGDIRDEDAEKELKPVLAKFDDQFQLAFEVDRTDQDLVAIYVPGSPDPRSGSVSYMTADRIRPVDAGFKEVVKASKHLGRGSGKFLSGCV